MSQVNFGPARSGTSSTGRRIHIQGSDDEDDDGDRKQERSAKGPIIVELSDEEYEENEIEFIDSDTGEVRRTVHFDGRVQRRKLYVTPDYIEEPSSPISVHSHTNGTESDHDDYIELDDVVELPLPTETSRSVDKYVE